MTGKKSRLEHRTAVDLVCKLGIGDRQFAEAQRVALLMRHAAQQRRGNAAEPYSTTDRPPIARLGFDKRFRRHDGRIELRTARIVRDRPMRNVDAHHHRTRRILALMLAELPLPREEPRRVGDTRAEPLIEIGRRRQRLEPQLKRDRHAVGQ
jgi:hypothetical protein